jgi:ATP-dependent DNA ligase
VRKLGLEGVIAKRRQSIYQPGKRSPDWVKVKFARRQEFVIGGFRPAGDTFESLLVGYYEGRKSMFAGKVRAGFTPALRGEIFLRLKTMQISKCPFANLPSKKTSHWGESITAEDMATLRWVKPQLVAEVSFTEWMRDNQLRHSAFVGLRQDKNPGDVARET